MNDWRSCWLLKNTQMTAWVSKWHQCTQMLILPEKWQFIQKEYSLRCLNHSWFLILGSFTLVSIVLHYLLSFLSTGKAYLILWWPCSPKVACSSGKKYLLWLLNCTLTWWADGEMQRNLIWHKLVSPISCLSRRSPSSYCLQFMVYALYWSGFFQETEQDLHRCIEEIYYRNWLMWLRWPKCPMVCCLQAGES